MVRFTCVLGSLFAFATVACGGGTGGAAGAGDTFALSYRSGASALLDLKVNASLRFSGKLRGVPRTLSSIGVGQAHAIFRGNGQQQIDLVLSKGSELWSGETFAVSLEFGRANNGEILDRGGALDMGCSFTWAGPDLDLTIHADCKVRQTGGGYSLTINESYDDETQLSGSLSFSPVPNEAYAYTPGYGCASGQICLSLDAADYSATTGYCLPTSNLKSEASPCNASCGSKLTIETGGTTICVCSAPCGRIATSGSLDPPVCDPAYGCIDY